MADSTHLLLPYLEGAQAQKHVTVNESLRTLDALVLLAVEDKDLTAPPGSPTGGARYIPAATATGAWSGKEKQIAHYVDGAWQFHPPRKGFIACVRDEDLLYVYNGGTWAPLDTMLDADLKAIAQLAPANDDVLQRKAGAWTNRTLAQLLGDLAVTGSWTPTLTASGGGLSVSYSLQAGRYVKIGPLVVAWGRISTSSVSGGSGYLTVGGLPFTSATSSMDGFGGTVSYASGITLGASYTQLNLLTLNNSTSAFLARTGSTQTADVVPVGNAANVTDLSLALAYLT